MTDARGDVYKFGINSWGLVTATYDLGDTTKADSAWYDAGGNERILKTRAGQVDTITYDALDRVDTIRGGTGFPAATFAYCPKGACVVAANANGRDSVRYDLLGRPDTAVQVMPDGTTRDTIVYAYDAQGRLISRGSPHGAPLSSATWSYDPSLGVVDTLCEAGVCEAIARDYEMKPTLMTYRPGLAGSWWYEQQYNTRHLPTTSDFTYATQDTVAGLTAFYDSLGHPDSLESYTGRAAAPYTKYLTYDRLGQIINDCSYQGQPYYCFNEWGNAGTNAYGYDGMGNDTTNGTVIAGNRYSDYNGWTLTYDANGEVTEKAGAAGTRAGADTTWFTWNGLGQLVVVRHDSAGSQLALDSLKYDALGRRVARTENGTTTWFLYDGSQVVADISASTKGLLAEYGFDGGNLFAVRTASDTLIALRAPLNGTVLGLANADGGAVVKRYDPLWTPFGEQTADSGLVLRYKMGSQEYDQEIGLYHLGVRYYDPELHRFLSEDPAGIAAGLNLYAYAGDDPLNATDPTGLDQCMAVLVTPYTTFPDGTTYIWWSDSYVESTFGDCSGGGGTGQQGAGGGGSLTGQTSTSTASDTGATACAPTSEWPHGAGLEANGSMAFGSPLLFGVAANGSAGGGLFFGNGGARFGGFLSAGGMAGGPVASLSATGIRGPTSNMVFGRSAGVGGGVFVTNANGASQTGGVFEYYGLSVGRLSVSLEVGRNGVWILALDYSVAGRGTSFAHYQTDTFATAGGAGCR